MSDTLSTSPGSIPSAACPSRRSDRLRRRRVHTAAYLLGARKELPDINDDSEELNGTRAAAQLWYSESDSATEARAQSEVEKGTTSLTAFS